MARPITPTEVCLRAGENCSSRLLDAMDAWDQLAFVLYQMERYGDRPQDYRRAESLMLCVWDGLREKIGNQADVNTQVEALLQAEKARR